MGRYGGQSSQRFRVIVRRLPQRDPCHSISRRALLGRFMSAGTALALGGCAGLGATGARYDASSLSLDPTLLVTTTRKPVNGGRTKPWFGPERATTMTVAQAKLGAPDESRLSLASVGIGDWRLDRVEPVSADAGDLVAQAGGGDVLIYVHGFKRSRRRCWMAPISPTGSSSAPDHGVL